MMHLDEDTLRILAELGDKYPGSVAEIMRVLREWNNHNRPWVMPQSEPIELAAEWCDCDSHSCLGCDCLHHGHGVKSL